MLAELDYKSSLDTIYSEQDLANRQSLQKDRGKALLSSAMRQPKDSDTDQTVMSLHDYLPKNGYVPISFVSHGINMIERSYANKNKLPPSMLKKRPRFTIDPRLPQAIDEYYNDIVLPRLRLTDQETVVFNQLKSTAGISFRGISQMPLDDKKQDRAFKIVQAQYMSMMKQRPDITVAPDGSTSLATDNLVQPGQMARFSQYLINNGVNDAEIKKLLAGDLSGRLLYLLAGYRDNPLKANMQIDPNKYAPGLRVRLQEFRKAKEKQGKDLSIRDFYGFVQTEFNEKKTEMQVEGDNDIWESNQPLSSFTKPGDMSQGDWDELMRATNDGRYPLKNIKNKWWKLSVFRNRVSSRQIKLSAMALGFLGILTNAWVRNGNGYNGIPEFLLKQGEQVLDTGLQLGGTLTQPIASIFNDGYDWGKHKFEDAYRIPDNPLIDPKINNGEEVKQPLSKFENFTRNTTEQNPAFATLVENIAQSQTTYTKGFLSFLFPDAELPSTQMELSKLLTTPEGKAYMENIIQSLANRIFERMGPSAAHEEFSKRIWQAFLSVENGPQGENWNDPIVWQQRAQKALVSAAVQYAEDNGIPIPPELDPKSITGNEDYDRFLSMISNAFSTISSAVGISKRTMMLVADPYNIESWKKLAYAAAGTGENLGYTLYNAFHLFKGLALLPLIGYHRKVTKIFKIPQEILQSLLGTSEPEELKRHEERVEDIISIHLDSIPEQSRDNPSMLRDLGQLTRATIQAESAFQKRQGDLGIFAKIKSQLYLNALETKFASKYFDRTDRMFYVNRLVQNLDSLSKALAILGQEGASLQWVIIKNLAAVTGLAISVLNPLGFAVGGIGYMLGRQQFQAPKQDIFYDNTTIGQQIQHENYGTEQMETLFKSIMKKKKTSKIRAKFDQFNKTYEENMNFAPNGLVYSGKEIFGQQMRMTKPQIIEEEKELI